MTTSKIKAACEQFWIIFLVKECQGISLQGCRLFVVLLATNTVSECQNKYHNVHGWPKTKSVTLTSSLDTQINQSINHEQVSRQPHQPSQLSRQTSVQTSVRIISENLPQRQIVQQQHAYIRERYHSVCKKR